MNAVSLLAWSYRIPDDDLRLLPGSLAIQPDGLAFAPATPEMQRARLLDAGVQMIADDGLAELSVARVARHAGVTPDVFHAHFADVEDCLLAAVEQGAGTLLALVAEACRAAPGWRAAVRDGLQVLLEILAEEEPFARLSVVELGAAGPRAREVGIRLARRFQKLFIGLADGPEPTPAAVLDATASVIHAVLYRHVASGRTARLPELLPALTYFATLPWLDAEAATADLGRPQLKTQLTSSGPIHVVAPL